MPTSITVAPGLTQSPRTISGRPTAATRMSAAAHDAGQIAGAAVGDGDGAALGRAAASPSACRRCSSGRSPPRGARLRSPSSALSRWRQPSGVQGTSAVEPDRQPPGVDRVEAVDILVGVDRVDHPAASMWPGAAAGRGCRRPPDRRSAARRGRAGRLRSCRREAHDRCSPSPASPRPRAWSGYRPRSPDPRRPARWQGRRGVRCAGVERRRRARRSRAHVSRCSFAVDPTRAHRLTPPAAERGERVRDDRVDQDADQQQHHHRRQVEPAEIGQDLAERAVERLEEAIEPDQESPHPLRFAC